jgi:hypothetical protein
MFKTNHLATGERTPSARMSPRIIGRSSKLGMHKKKPRTKRGLWYQASIGVNHAHQPYMDLRRSWLR